MNGVEEIVTAGRLSNVTEITGFEEDYNPGIAFSLLLLPKNDDSSLSDGDWTRVSAMLPFSDNQFVRVPVRIGEWQEMVFTALEAGVIDEDLEVWVSPMKNYKMQ